MSAAIDASIAHASASHAAAATRTSSSSPRPSVWRRLWDESVAVLLPANFPASVTASYLPYCKWQAVHSISGSAMLVLSTQSLVRVYPSVCLSRSLAPGALCLPQSRRAAFRMLSAWPFLAWLSEIFVFS